MKTLRYGTASCIVMIFVVGLSAPLWAAETAAGGTTSAWSPPPVAKLVMGHIGRLLVLRSDLDVTSEQRDKIRATVKKHSGEIKPAVGALLEKRVALRQAVLAEPSDQAAIRKSADDLGKALGDAAVVTSRVVAEMKTTFTPDQIERIRTFRQDCDAANAAWTKKIGN